MAEAQENAYWVADWFVDPTSNRIERKGQQFRLEMRTMGILVRLSEQPGATVSKDEIIAAAWPTHVVSDQSVATAISDLRRILNDDPRNPRYIQTVPKRGYRLIAPVSQFEQTRGSRPHNKNQSNATSRNVRLLASGKRKVAAFSLIVLLFVAIYSQTDSMRPAPAGPIVVGDICVGNVNSATEDLAYGFGELLTVALTRNSNRTIIRLADEQNFRSANDDSGTTNYDISAPPMLVDSSIVQSGDESLIVLEILDGRNQELVWASKFPVTSESLESSVLEAVENIILAISPAGSAQLPR